MIGQKISHFLVENELAWKGPGSLLSAVDERDQRPVDLLFLSPADYQRFGAIPLLERLEAASEVESPYLQRILEVFPRDSGILLLLEPSFGQPLGQWQVSAGPRIKESLSIALQLAEALSAAHSAGVPHGLLRPETLLIDQGLLRVRPLGLAALAAPHRFSAPETFAGPQGPRAPAAASDVYSFGLLLGVLLTGRNSQTSQQALVKEILDDQYGEAQWTAEAAADLERLRQACVHSDPGKRPTITVVRRALEDLRQKVDFASLVEPAGSYSRISKRNYWPWVFLVAFLIPIAVWTTVAAISRPKPKPVNAVVRPLTNDSGYTAEPAVSPDGKWIAFVSDRDTPGNLDLYVMPAAGGPVRVISNLPEDEREPDFSPDGEHLIFRLEARGGGLYRVSFAGGTPEFVAKQGRRPRYSPDGRDLLYWSGSEGRAEIGALLLRDQQSGETRRLAADFHTAQDPVWSPDGERILFAGRRNAGDYLEFWTVDREGGEAYATGASPALRRQKIIEGIPVVWSGSTLYLIGREGSDSDLYRMEVDPVTGRSANQPEPVTRGIGIDVYPALLPDGRLVFSRFRETANLLSAALDAQSGKFAAAPETIINDGLISDNPSLSADGRTLVYTSRDESLQNVVWKDLADGSGGVLTTNLEPAFSPVGVISADGRRAAFSVLENSRTSVYVRSLPNGQPVLACHGCAPPAGWLPGDIPQILLTRQGAVYQIDVLNLNDQRIRTLTQHRQYGLMNPAASPDGKWVAFHALTGPHRRQIFVIPASPSNAAGQSGWTPITARDGRVRDPQWSPDGSLLYYLRELENARSLWAQPLHPETKAPLGAAFLVYDPPTPRGVRLAGRLSSFATGGGRVVLAETKVTGNLWIAEWPEPLSD